MNATGSDYHFRLWLHSQTVRHCVYCGTICQGRTCSAHADLPRRDPHYSTARR